MGLKDEAKKIVDNTKDATSEAVHRVTAKAEEIKREMGHDTMKPSEKIDSIANQAKNEVQAEIDHTKRDIRNTDMD